MRTIGRIILLIVAIAILSTAIPGLISDIQNLNRLGWDNLFLDAEKNAYFWRMMGHGLNCFTGLIAFLGFLRGRKSVLLALIAVIMLIAPVTTMMMFINGGVAITGLLLWGYVVDFALPIFFFLGFLLV